MKFKEQFKLTQNIAYQTIFNGFKNNKLSHAYLLSGTASSPLKQAAILIAQSFICEHNEDFLACEECLTCQRIENETYYDYMFIDGSKASIKKEQIEKIQIEFSKTALEKAGKKIYIIHLIENSSPGAINSLLKFLEEPVEDVLAIVTTQNIAKVLPTIVSRCQLIRIKETPKDELVNQLVLNGYSQEDSYILTTIYNNYDDIVKFYEKGRYITIKDLVIDLLDYWSNQGDQLPYYFSQNIASKLFEKGDDKESLTIFLDILEIALKDVINHSQNGKIVLIDSEKIIKGLANKLTNVNSKIKEIIFTKGNISVNANLMLLIDSLLYKISSFYM